MISNVHATGAILTSSVTGLPGQEAEDVTLSDIRIDSVEGGKSEWADLNVPEKERSYPEARMFGRLPAYGLYARHVNGLRLSKVHIEARKPDPRPLLVCDDVKNLDAVGLSGTGPGNGSPLLQLTDVDGAFLHGSRAPVNTGLYARIAGGRSSDIVIHGNDLSQAERVVETAAGASASAVSSEGNHVRS
jgi:hypothetical protein